MRAHRWQIIVSVLLTLGVVILAIVGRSQIVEAFELMRGAKLEWLLLAFALELFGFFLSSQVYHTALRPLGHHVSALRLWAMTLVAIILSQSVPAGGVASYAFLVQGFRRRGIASGHAALLASLEALSYASAMVILFIFSLCFLIFREGFGAANPATLIAAGVGLSVIVGAVVLLTRPEPLLRRWLIGCKNGLARLVRRTWDDGFVTKLLGDVVRGRELITAQRGEVALLVLIQLAALTVHSLAMLMVLWSLGVSTSLFVVVAAFAVALVSSTFNVLPGGGGTVEAALVLSLQALGVGSAAISAAVIFRLLNFWFILPIAAVCYRWIMHGKRVMQPAQDQEPQV